MTKNLVIAVAAFLAGVLSYSSLVAQTPARRVIAPKNVPYAGYPYSPGILAENTLYLAGQLGRDPATSQLIPGGMEPELRQVMMNVREVLREAGMDLADVVNVTAYIVDYKDFDTYNKVYREYFPKDPPARATVAVAALNQGARVELQMVAVKTK